VLILNEEAEMARLSARMKEIFEKRNNIVLATASKAGTPNVVVVAAKKILDDETILISDQYFSKTLANMKENPQVALTFWDKAEGYQLKGHATIETSGRLYEDTTAWIEALGKKIDMPLESKGAVVIKIEEIYTITPGPHAGARIA